MSEFFSQQFCDLNPSYALIIEDDGRVAYAYLMKHKEIIGDVWLYNQLVSPTEVNWQDAEEMHFLNPKAYIKENIQPIISDDDIELVWMLTADIDLVTEVAIYINGKLHARLAPGSKPGWSKAVTKDGPLAKVYN